MSLAIVHSRAQVGVEAPAVTVEAHLANGLPSLALVGLPETAVKESKDRVRSAILNCAFEFPPRRITLNLAPADLPKDGGRFDLAIALGILAASGQVPPSALERLECLGELALSGAIRPVQGVLPAALAARAAGRTLMVPKANAEEASLASGLEVIAVEHLLEVAAHLNGQTPIAPYQAQGLLRQVLPYPDLAEVQGQIAAKRALLVAAAGSHNLLFSGPPGTGKTLLASRLPGLLPPLDEREALEVAAIHNAEGYQKIRTLLSQQYNLSQIEPNIQVYNVDFNGDRSLTLRYIPQNRVPLAASQQQVLKHLHRLWGFTVYLEQQNEDGSTELLASCPEQGEL